MDTNRLKIGDGVTAWNDLPYIDGKREIGDYDYLEDFPAVGSPEIIYKAEKEQRLYQYNPETAEYELLSDGKGVEDINIINGGTA